MTVSTQTPRRLSTRIATILSAFILLAVAADGLSAQRRGVGVGVMVGEPTGISAISWLGGGNALDLVAAWSFLEGGSFYLHADYQFHGYVENPMTLFAGIGGFVVLEDDPKLGARVPLGISFLFRNAPLDFFIEVAPGITLAPATDFYTAGGIGVRFYL